MTRRHLITGERDWTDTLAVASRIVDLRDSYGAELVIVHGDCPTGADAIAQQICEELGIPTERYPVDHSLDGPWPGAGPRRNRRMGHAKPIDGWTAFWSGKRVKSGTLDCFAAIVGELKVSGNVVARGAK